jgi:hypothetical protein
MERVEKVDRKGYSVHFIQALLAIAYWTGFRRSEVIGDAGLKWKVKSGEVRTAPPFPGLLKENIWAEEEEGSLFISQVARKHGHRVEPVVLPLTLPFVDLIVERWKETKEKEKVFPIDETAQWQIFKNIDPKLYWHVFVLTRVTKLAEDRRNSLADIVRFTGKDPVTVSVYMARVGRNNRELGERMKDEA